MVTCEALILGSLLFELEDGVIDDERTVILSLGLFFLIPIFVFGGVGVIASRISTANKFFYVPILAVFIPLMVSIPASEYFDKEE